MIEMKMRGGAELIAHLKQFSQDIIDQGVDEGLKAAATVIREEVKMLAPFKSGALKASIQIGEPINAYGIKAAIQVLAVGKHAWLAPIFEWPSAAHYLSTKGSGTVLKLGPDEFISGDVVHPGVYHPFFRPGLDAGAARAIDAMTVTIREFVDKYAASGAILSSIPMMR